MGIANNQASINKFSIFNIKIQTTCNMSQNSVKKQRTIDLGELSTWGTLAPLTIGLSSFEMKDTLILIGRNPECSIQINDKRLSGKHCRIQKKQSDIVLLDLSMNGTFVNDKKVGKGNQVTIDDKAQIWLLPASHVQPTQALGYRLELAQKSKKQEESQKQQEKTENKKKQNKQAKNQKQPGEAKKQTPGGDKKGSNFSQAFKDQITCTFCIQIMHQPVTVQPCNHRFCGACLTQLVQKKKGDCIQCRKTLTSAAKDSFANSLIEDYLKEYPEEKRDQKQMDQMTNKNIFGFDPISIPDVISGKVTKKKAATKTTTTSSRGRGRRSGTIVRASSDLSASDDDEARCRECMTARNGFQCGSTQRHVGCMNCGKLIADRNDNSLHQSCLLCTQFYCNLYYPPCNKTGIKLKLIRDRKGESKIDTELFRGNRFQFQAIRDYLSKKGHNSRNVFEYVQEKMQKNQFAYIIDRKIMMIPPVGSREIKVKSDDAVCDTCWKDLWFQMVFYYRTQVNFDMPKAIKDRPDCYWGVNCRTMSHNTDHARRYNHVLFQTRF